MLTSLKLKYYQYKSLKLLTKMAKLEQIRIILNKLYHPVILIDMKIGRLSYEIQKLSIKIDRIYLKDKL